MVMNDKFLVIFDMNGVLISKGTRLNEFFSETPIKTNSKTIKCCYPNKDLEILGEFYNSHSFCMGLWTTVMKRNAEPIYTILCDIIGSQFDCFLTQEQCSIGEMTGSIKTVNCIKDLRKPSELLNIPVKNCLLIDDCEGKRYENQNFLLFDSNERDLIRVIKYIDQFLVCTDADCIAKRI